MAPGLVGTECPEEQGEWDKAESQVGAGFIDDDHELGLHNKGHEKPMECCNQENLHNEI